MLQLHVSELLLLTGQKSEKSSKSSPYITGPISGSDEMREIWPPTKKKSSLGLGTILVPMNGHGHCSGGK